MPKIFVTIFFTLIFSLNLSASEKYDDEFAEFDYEFAQSETTQKKETSSDPLESYNRAMTNFNDSFYIYAYRPVVSTIDMVLNDNIQKGIKNVFNNSTFPIRFINSILQLKFDKAMIEAGRFIINTTIGVVGIFDIAKDQFNLVTTPEDFGQTLGFYGVGTGWHIVLPILGPSNVRDIVAMVPDSYLNPSTYVESRQNHLVAHEDHAWKLKATDVLIGGSLNYKQIDMIRKDAIDMYPYLKNTYEQYRAKQIKE
jgi:phospholipid-binding lipoprotein MlaA